MSKGDDGSLEGIEGKLPLLGVLKGHSTEVFKYGTPETRLKKKPSPYPKKVVYEVVDDPPVRAADTTSGAGSAKISAFGGAVATMQNTAERGRSAIGLARVAPVASSVSEEERAEGSIRARRLASIQLTKVDDVGGLERVPELVETQTTRGPMESAN